MKRFITSLAAASALLATTPAIAAPFNSVFWFDERINVTNRVLDGTIQADIDRVHPFLKDADQELIDAQARLTEARRKKNRAAVEEHCRRERRVSKPADENRCGPGLKK